MKTIHYIPSGVCSREYNIVINDEGKVESCQIIGGCHGNLQGIASLIKGMDVNEVIQKLEGIRCGFKSTSCPDQIAKALKQYINQD